MARRMEETVDGPAALATKEALRLDGSGDAPENRSSVNHDTTTAEPPAPPEIYEPAFTTFPPRPPSRAGFFRSLVREIRARAGRMGWKLNLLLLITALGT